MYIKWLTVYFTDLCRSTCIYNVYPPSAPCPYPSLRNCVHYATSWHVVKAQSLPHSTITSKMC